MHPVPSALIYTSSNSKPDREGRMKQFFLFALLVGATHAFLPPDDTKCIVIENIVPCFPILGGSVYIQLMSNASSYIVYFERSATRIIGLKNGNVKIHQDYSNRAEFFINNGTVKITDMKKDDSGVYMANIYHGNGTNLKDFSFSLEVKDNIYTILFICLIVVGGVLLLVCCCCMFRKLKCCRK